MLILIESYHLHRKSTRVIKKERERERKSKERE